MPNYDEAHLLSLKGLASSKKYGIELVKKYPEKFNLPLLVRNIFYQGTTLIEDEKFAEMVMDIMISEGKPMENVAITIFHCFGEDKKMSLTFLMKYYKSVLKFLDSERLSRVINTYIEIYDEEFINFLTKENIPFSDFFKYDIYFLRESGRVINRAYKRIQISEDFFFENSGKISLEALNPKLNDWANPWKNPSDRLKLYVNMNELF